MVTGYDPGYTWDFCGGQVAIDFTNTIGSRGGAPEEHFNSYGDVLSWAETRAVIGGVEAQRLRAEAERRPRDAREALAAIRALRGSLYRVRAASAEGRRAPPADLARLNAHVETAFAHAHLARRRGRLELAFDAVG